MSDSILDTIIANHGGPQIVREQHDLSQISVEESAIRDAVARAAGVQTWDAAEYGITAEQAKAMIDAAQTPEARAKVMAELRQRAIQRAGLDVSGGKVSVMTVVGPNGEKLPWHQLGTMIADAVNSRQAEQLANLGWKVLKKPALYTWAGKEQVSAETFLLVREDTGLELGSVGNKYQVIDNEAAFEFMDLVLAEFGAKYETAGALYGGKKVWMQARLPGLTFEAQAGDTVEAFATFTLDHSGAGCDVCFPTTQRVVCANTLRLANGDKQKGIRIRHTGDVKAKVNDARTALGVTIKRVENFKDAARHLVKTPLAIEPYANDVLDAVLEVTAAQAAMGADVLAAAVAKTDANRKLEEKRFQKLIDQRQGLLDDILDRHESERCTPHGSGWGCLNAVTESADYYDPAGRRKKEFKQDRRLESIVFGEADDLKQVAFQQAMASVR